MYAPSQDVDKLRTDNGKVEICTITYPAVAALTHGDFIRVSTAGKTFAIWLDKNTGYSGIAEETTVTIPATADATQADYFHIINKAGNKFAVWLDIDDAGTVPTGALYVASDTKVKASIITGGSAIDNAAAVVTALGTMAGMTVVDNEDGTITFTCTAAGVVTDASAKNADDSGAGSVSVTVDVQGVDSVSPAGIIYTACDYKIRVNVITGDTAAQVGTKVYNNVILNADFLRLMDVKDNGNGTMSIVQRQSGNVTDPTPKNITEAGAGSITASSTQGVNITNVQASSPSSFTNDPGIIT